MAAVPGTLHINPTNATTGGTAVTGIFEDRMEFDDGRETRAFGSGIEADAWSMVAAPPVQPATLIIPIRKVEATTLQLLFSLLSTGTGIDSHGGNSTPPNGNPPAVALVVRPKNTSQDYLYGPRWKLSPDSVKRITWHRNIARYDGDALVLVPQRSLDGTLQAFKFGTASAINTAYSL